jgi:hypothetical protein
MIRQATGHGDTMSHEPDAQAEALRRAFVEGARWFAMHRPYMEKVEAEAARRYPDTEPPQNTFGVLVGADGRMWDVMGRELVFGSAEPPHLTPAEVSAAEALSRAPEPVLAEPPRAPREQEGVLICERCGQPGAQYEYPGAETAVHDGMMRCIKALRAAPQGPAEP